MRVVLAAAALLAMTLSAAAAPANLLTNGGFEDTGGTFDDNGFGFETLSGGATDIPGWTVIGATVFWDSEDWLGWPRFEGAFSITGRQGGVQQLLTGLTPGREYRVSFMAGGDPFGDVDRGLAQGQAGIVGADPYGFSVAGGTRDPFAWVEITFSFVASGSEQLFFIEALAGDIAVDDAKVTVVPLPFALPLFLGALGVLRLVGRRS